MFDWIPNLLLYIYGHVTIAVFLGCVIGFGVRDLLEEWHDRRVRVTRSSGAMYDSMQEPEPPSPPAPKAHIEPSEQPDINRSQAYHDAQARRLLKF